MDAVLGAGGSGARERLGYEVLAGHQMLSGGPGPDC